MCFHAATLHVIPPFLWYQENRCHDHGFPCTSSDWNEFPRQIHKQTWNSDSYVIRVAQSQYTWVFHCLASVILLSVEEMQVVWCILRLFLSAVRLVQRLSCLFDWCAQANAQTHFCFSSRLWTPCLPLRFSERNCCIVAFS